MVEVENLNFRYGREPVLENVSFTANSGEITAVIGANGAGKSTTLKCVAGLLKYEGRVLLSDKNGRDLDERERARKVSYLCQNNGCYAELSVFEVILMGLVNELSFHVSQDDTGRVKHIMELMDIDRYAGRRINQLSGGQQQLVFIAQALVKEPEILIMDEPTSALDLNRQFHLMELVRRLTKEHGFTTMVCHHHLDLVTRYADRVLVLNSGRIYCADTPANAFTARMFRDVYGMDVEFCTDREGVRHMVPVNRLPL